MAMATLPSRIYTQKTSDAGTGLFTSDAISPGVEILRIESSLVSVLDSVHLKDCCGECKLWLPESGQDRGPENRTLKICQGCKIMRYCSKVCLPLRRCMLLFVLPLSISFVLGFFYTSISTHVILSCLVCIKRLGLCVNQPTKVE